MSPAAAGRGACSGGGGGTPFSPSPSLSQYVTLNLLDHWLVITKSQCWSWTAGEKGFSGAGRKGGGRVPLERREKGGGGPAVGPSEEYEIDHSLEGRVGGREKRGRGVQSTFIRIRQGGTCRVKGSGRYAGFCSVIRSCSKGRGSREGGGGSTIHLGNHRTGRPLEAGGGVTAHAFTLFAFTLLQNPMSSYHQPYQNSLQCQ